MNPIDQLFSRLQADRRKAFIPFVTAGDPDLATTAKLVKELAQRGASLVEIGFPYSDPIADGAVIQASYTRALDRGLRIDDIFKRIHGLTHRSVYSPLDHKIPFVAMVSYSLVQHRGNDKFLNQAI